MKRKYVAKILLVIFLLSVFVKLWIIADQNEGISFVQKMGPGINLGNSLDSTYLKKYDDNATDLDYETFWKNPRINKQQLDAVKDAGFHSVRIPVTWEEHMDENGIIHEEWLNRVQEVVDLAMEEGLYVIVDTHHEEWLNLNLENKDKIIEQFSSLWEQIAKRFQSYDKHLLFEGMNEPRLRDTEYEWTEGTEDLRAFVNELNEEFVKTVRNSGGKNGSRFLLITTYAGITEKKAIDDLKIIDDHCIVAVHAYIPYDFCQNIYGTKEWGSDAEKKQLEKLFIHLNETFIKEHIPVMITECGCVDKNNFEEQEKYLKELMALSVVYKIPCMLWDNGTTFRILDRSNVEILHSNRINMIIKSAYSKKYVDKMQF